MAALGRIASGPQPAPSPQSLRVAAPGQGSSSSPGTLEQIGHEADMAWAGVKRIMSLLNVEQKRKVVGVGGTNISNAGYLNDLTSSISQGVTGTTRVGDSMKVKGVRVKGFFVFGNAVTTLTIVLGHSKDGTPAIADVFSFTGAQGGMNYPLITQQPADKWSASRLLILDSVRFPVQEFELFVPFSHDVTYAAGTSTVLTGAVWFAAISDLAAGATTPVLQYTYALDFVDN